MKDKNAENIKEYFKNKSAFDTAEIADYYRLTKADIKLTTVNWRIFSLVQKGVLQRVGRGKFCLGTAKIFIPEISTKLKAVYREIHKVLPYTKFCVWHTLVFNEFMNHQQGKFFYIIETEKEAMEAAFYLLKDNKKQVFLNPAQDILYKYLPENKDVYFVQPLVTEAPTQIINGVCTVTLEKMLVDIFCNDVIFASQQGAEMRHIFTEAFAKYAVNQNTMLRYANRRNKKNEFSEYVKTISNYRQ